LEKGARRDFKRERFSKRFQENKADYDVTLALFLVYLGSLY